MRALFLAPLLLFACVPQDDCDHPEPTEGLLAQAVAGRVTVTDREVLFAEARDLVGSPTPLPDPVVFEYEDLEIIGAFADGGAFARWLLIELTLGPAAPAVDVEDALGLTDRLRALQAADDAGSAISAALTGGDPLDFYAACLELRRAPMALDVEPLLGQLEAQEAGDTLLLGDPDEPRCALTVADGLVSGLLFNVPGLQLSPGEPGATSWFVEELVLRLGEVEVRLPVRVTILPGGRVVIRSEDGSFEAEGDAQADGEALDLRLRGRLQRGEQTWQIQGMFRLADGVLRGWFEWQLEGERPQQGEGEGEGEAVADCCRVDAITVARSKGTNVTYGFSFNARIQVTGKDLTKCEIRQQARVTEANKEYDGSATPNATLLAGYEAGLRPGVNTGVWVTDTNWDWAALKDDALSEHIDHQVHNVANRMADLDEDTRYRQVQLNDTTREFRIEIRWGQMIIATHDWSYTWKNDAAKMPGGLYAGAHVAIGVFSGINGITGLDALND